MVSLISKISKRLVIDIDHQDAKKAKIVCLRPASNGSVHGVKEVSVRIPMSISLLAFGRKDGLPSYVAKCPQVVSLVARGWLTVIHHAEEVKSQPNKKLSKEGSK